MTDFDYHAPATLDELLALRERHGAQAALLAGGTDLLVQLKEGQRRPSRVIDLKHVPGLADWHCDARGLRIGAATTTRALEASPALRRDYAGLAEAVTHFASIQVRHRATVVGNVCRASPSADTLPPLIADGAVIELCSRRRGAREVALEDYCSGPGRTALAEDEVALALHLPPPPPGTGKAYIKHGRRIEMELATVGVAVTLTRDGDFCRALRIVLAAVAPTPLRVPQAEALLAGRELTPAAIAAAADAAAAAARPIGDVRGSAAYRREMVRVLTRRAIESAAQRAQEVTP
ncbi:MAG: xanthine dehydrogenase family protein subunit M [Burkholderiales bacterium]|nr:xanthine dehydrogenase family protein subunit M [Burkholderiales bacterium]